MDKKSNREYSFSDIATYDRVLDFIWEDCVLGKHSQRDDFTKLISAHVIFVLFVVVLSSFLGMQGGTPFYHPDFLIDKAEYAMNNFGNPNFFHYPALMIYLNGLVYSLYEAILSLFPSKVSGVLIALADKETLGHILTTVFSVIAVLSTYGSGYLLTKSRVFSTLGSLILFTAPLWNADTHFVTVDVPLAAMCVLTLYVLLTVLREKRKVKNHNVILLGVLIGLVASTKYNGAIIASSVVLALLFRTKPFIQSVKLIVYCGFSAIITFLLTNPYILIEFQKFVDDFTFELEHASGGHFGYTVDTMHFHISESLYNGLGGFLLVLSAFGAVFLLIKKDQKVYVKLAFFVFPAIYLLLLFSTKLAFQRYALPLIPFLALLAIYGVFELGQYAKTYLDNVWSRLLRLSFIMLLTVAIGLNLTQSLRHNILLQRKDTRAIIRSLFLGNVKVIDSYTIGTGPYLKKTSLNFLSHVNFIEYSRDFDVLVFDSFSYDRYIYEDDDSFKVDFSYFLNGKALIVSPYDENKEDVPFSPKSLYSPYFPDLAFRTRPGPYIEVYFSDPIIGSHFSEALERLRVDYKIIELQHGYYYENFGMVQK